MYEGLELTFRQQVPDAFTRRFLTGVFAAYKAAALEGKQHHDPIELKSVLGDLERSKVETNFREAAQLSGLAAHVIPVGNGSYTYTRVVAGDIVMTQSKVQWPGGFTDDANFRQTLASGQLVLDVDPTAPPADATYALFIHTRSVWPVLDRHKWGHLPGSAHVAFPAPSVKKYLHVMDLFEMFPDVVKANTPQEWDDLTLHQYVKRSRRHVA